MKILCLSTKTNPCNQGGIETFCRVLKKFYNNIEFFSFPNKEKRYYDVKNIIELKADKWYEKIIYKLFGKTYLSKLKLKKMEYDIYILNFPKDIELIPKDKKNIILVQHINYSKYVEEYFRNDIKLINECKERLKYFVFLSEYDRDKFVKEMNFPIYKTKIIRHSCELEIQNIKKIRNKKLIMICRLNNRQKRVDLAIKAMKRLKEFTLDIYGEGIDKDNLLKLIKENNLTNVFLRGGTSKVKEKLDESGIFIMTSDYEGYPITTIEVMKRGLPIILRNTFDSALDIVKDNGILLDKEWNEDSFIEAVEKIYNNYEYYSLNSIKMGKRHDFDLIKEKWDEIILK